MFVLLAFTDRPAAQSTELHVTVWQGVYTEAQAKRGQSEYTTHCANCHRDDLTGYNEHPQRAPIHGEEP